jgi:hypothetical protein
VTAPYRFAGWLVLDREGWCECLELEPSPSADCSHEPAEALLFPTLAEARRYVLEWLTDRPLEVTLPPRREKSDGSHSRGRRHVGLEAPGSPRGPLYLLEPIYHAPREARP